MLTGPNSPWNTIENLNASAQTLRIMMRVTHHHGDDFPPPKFLYGVDVGAGLHKSGSKGVAQIMKPKTFHVRPSHRGIEDTQEIPRIHPVASPGCQPR